MKFQWYQILLARQVLWDRQVLKGRKAQLVQQAQLVQPVLRATQARKELKDFREFKVCKE
jgi:hypothetical protein